MARWRLSKAATVSPAVSRLRLAVALFAGLSFLLGDGAGAAMALTLSSPAFKPGTPLPAKYTCEGDDISPPLTWDGVPQGTKSLALIVDDPDAPDPKAPKRVWVHWVVYNLSPDAAGLQESAGKDGLPKGAMTGLNDFKLASYRGPCPPIGRHRYFHKLYALDMTLPLKTPTKAELEAAMKGHVLAEAELIGTYQKGDP
jgi:Raf kinase inhibitor-like YbhB/YbcL family protein